MSGNYILGEDGRTPVQVEDLGEWARWYETSREVRRVALTFIKGATVSTVFLGIDHNFLGGEPLLFETMAKGYCARYSTWEEAEVGHSQTILKLLDGELEDE